MAPKEGAASRRHRAEREGEPRTGLTAGGEPEPQKGDKEECPSHVKESPVHSA